jgi:hypothetical protein
MDTIYEQVINNLDNNMDKYIHRNMSDYGTTFQTEYITYHNNYNQLSFNSQETAISMADDDIKKLFDNVTL